jgi:spore germination protein KB
MKAEKQLTREQVLFITFMGVIGNIVYIHTWIDDETDRSAWLAGMVGILLIIPFALLILYLGKFMPKGTLLNIIEDGLGKLSASVICLAYFLINILIGTTHLDMFTSMINTFFLPLTPSWVVMAFVILIGFVLCKGKLQNFARFFEILAVLGIFNYFLTFFFSLPNNINIEYIYPIFDTTLYGFIKGSLFVSGSASETLLILIIFVRSIPNPEKHFSWVVKGIVLASVVFPLAILIIIAIMSPELAKRIAYGGVNAARLIAVGEYIQGLEVFILIAYQVIAVGKAAICLYCAWTSIKDLVNNKMPGTLLFISSVLMLASAMWIGSYNKAYSIAVFAANYIILPFSLLVIILAAICVKLRNNKLKRFSK